MRVARAIQRRRFRKDSARQNAASVGSLANAQELRDLLWELKGALASTVTVINEEVLAQLDELAFLYSLHLLRRTRTTSAYTG